MAKRKKRLKDKGKVSSSMREGLTETWDYVPVEEMQLAAFLSTTIVQPPQETIILQRTNRHDLFYYFM